MMQLQSIGLNARIIINSKGELGCANVVWLGDETTGCIIDFCLTREMAFEAKLFLQEQNCKFDLGLASHNHVDHLGGAASFFPLPLYGTSLVAETCQKMASVPELIPCLLRLFNINGHADIPSLEDISNLDNLPSGVVSKEFKRAHSTSDIVLINPLGVGALGDLCATTVAPLLRHSDPLLWLSALDDLLELNIEVVLPGHGEPGNSLDLKHTYQYIYQILEEASQLAELWDSKIPTGLVTVARGGKADVADSTYYSAVDRVAATAIQFGWNESNRSGLNIAAAICNILGIQLNPKPIT